ncbi:MAG: hypothetical protein IV298_15355 [Cylindrospermopsis raciborskii KL1]|uniref:hypothetical protein n=1 Tax=Cylindrospermopsis raciborskii TaxID=77022 RepID=UPI001A2BE1C2|nr:hypothetical protein [Cylindrospermopsis raciborskii]MBG0744816.1 hypothetical protein [Cylindrospermopsis raciborskii KL1]
MVRTTLAPSVEVGAPAAWMGLAALAALAANLFRFRFSAGVSLGGSRTRPGISLEVPAANWPPVSFRVSETAWPCDISLELVVNLAKLSSKPVEVGPVDNSCPVISAYDFGCSRLGTEVVSGGEPEVA